MHKTSNFWNIQPSLPICYFCFANAQPSQLICCPESHPRAFCHGNSYFGYLAENQNRSNRRIYRFWRFSGISRVLNWVSNFFKYHFHTFWLWGGILDPTFPDLPTFAQRFPIFSQKIPIFAQSNSHFCLVQFPFLPRIPSFAQSCPGATKITS